MLLGGRAVGKFPQRLKTIRRLVEPAGRAQELTIAAGYRFHEPGDFLADFRVGPGRPGGVRLGPAVAVARPAFQHMRGALCRPCPVPYVRYGNTPRSMPSAANRCTFSASVGSHPRVGRSMT